MNHARPPDRKLAKVELLKEMKSALLACYTLGLLAGCHAFQLSSGSAQFRWLGRGRWAAARPTPTPLLARTSSGFEGELATAETVVYVDEAQAEALRSGDLGRAWELLGASASDDEAAPSCLSHRRRDGTAAGNRSPRGNLWG